MKVAGSKRRWLASVTSYTLAGSVTSAFVGVTLGSLGWLLAASVLLADQQVVLAGLEKIGVGVAIAVGIGAIARELGWIYFPLPQLMRQTRQEWGILFPGKAAVLWGLDLGLVFTTWLTFSGVWLLVILAISAGDWIYGGTLFVVYWLGRTLPVWVAPLLQDSDDASRLMDSIAKEYRFFQRIHVFGLAWAVVVLTLWLST